MLSSRCASPYRRCSSHSGSKRNGMDKYITMIFLSVLLWNNPFNTKYPGELYSPLPYSVNVVFIPSNGMLNYVISCKLCSVMPYMCMCYMHHYKPYTTVLVAFSEAMLMWGDVTLLLSALPPHQHCLHISIASRQPHSAKTWNQKTLQYFVYFYQIHVTGRMQILHCGTVISYLEVN